MRGSTKPTSAMRGWAGRSWSGPHCGAPICVAHICAWQGSTGRTFPTPIFTMPKGLRGLSYTWRASIAELGCPKTWQRRKMPKDEHVALLGRGAAVWNAWRTAHDEVPDLSRAGLRGLDLSGYDLSRVDLRGADLRGTNLRD